MKKESGPWSGPGLPLVHTVPLCEAEREAPSSERQSPGLGIWAWPAEPRLDFSSRFGRGPACITTCNT